MWDFALQHMHVKVFVFWWWWWFSGKTVFATEKKVCDQGER